MGFNVTSIGYLEFNDDDAVYDKIKETLSKYFDTRCIQTSYGTRMIRLDGIFDADNVCGLEDSLVSICNIGHISDGCVNCRDDDDNYWKYVYLIGWVRWDAELVYHPSRIL